MNSELITTAEAIAILGWKKSTFHVYRSRGKFNACKSPDAYGRRKWLRSRFEQIRDGQSLHQFGKKRTA